MNITIILFYLWRNLLTGFYLLRDYLTSIRNTQICFNHRNFVHVFGKQLIFDGTSFSDNLVDCSIAFWEQSVLQRSNSSRGKTLM